MTDVSGMKIERDVSGILVMEPYIDEAKLGVFAFGHLVDDYYVLNKEAIWTITAAATREIDRQLQDVSGQLLTTTNQLQDVSGQLGIANAKITQLENDILTIKTNLGL